MRNLYKQKKRIGKQYDELIEQAELIQKQKVLIEIMSSPFVRKIHVKPAEATLH